MVVRKFCTWHSFSTCVIQFHLSGEYLQQHVTAWVVFGQTIAIWYQFSATAQDRSQVNRPDSDVNNLNLLPTTKLFFIMSSLWNMKHSVMEFKRLRIGCQFIDIMAKWAQLHPIELNRWVYIIRYTCTVDLDLLIYWIEPAYIRWRTICKLNMCFLLKHNIGDCWLWSYSQSGQVSVNYWSNFIRCDPRETVATTGTTLAAGIRL